MLIRPKVCFVLHLRAKPIDTEVGRFFVRGNVNHDQGIDISDAIGLLYLLFAGGPGLECSDAGDANDDGVIDISDAVLILSYLFLGERILPPPSGYCGVDITKDDLDCGGQRICLEGSGESN